VSDYFARLAALTLGRTAAIRPAASRYAPTPALEFQADDGVVHGGTERVRDDRDPPVAAALSDQAPAARAEDGVRAAFTAAHEPFDAGPHARADGDADADAVRHEAGGGTNVSASVPTRWPRADEPRAADRVGEHIAAPPRERDIDEPQPASPLVAGPVAMHRAVLGPISSERAPRAGRSPEPGGAVEHASAADAALNDAQSQTARLLPLADARHASAVPAASANRASHPPPGRRTSDLSASRAAADEPADVFVHIGRIDVRAVAAPGRGPAPAPRPASQKHSLAAYLRARDAGRP
jgi:hypothetical protein